MSSRLSFVLLGLSTLSGCTATTRLYPVHGPLSTQNPPPVYVGKFSDGLKSGDISITLNDGEVAKGRWQLVPRPNSSTAVPPAGTMSAEWDSVYGTGFYVAHVLGARLYAHALVTGNHGTVLNVEVYKPETKEDNTPGTIKGVAKDNRDNLYKVAF